MAEKPKHHFTDRVAGRAALALALAKDAYSERRAKAGLLVRDLEAISRFGREAARQDGLQKEALAGQRTDLEGKKEDREAFDSLSDNLRNCLPMVSLDLKKQPERSGQDLGKWLAKVSFSRFRVRLPSPTTDEPAAPAETAEAGEGPAELAAAPADTTSTSGAGRVERRDRLARVQAVQQLTEAVLAEGREPIVEALAERGLPRERLEWLRDRATEQVNTLGGTLRFRAVEATKLESEAVGQQKECWESCRRSIRASVPGDPTLEELWAKC